MGTGIDVYWFMETHPPVRQSLYTEIYSLFFPFPAPSVPLLGIKPRASHPICKGHVLSPGHSVNSNADVSASPLVCGLYSLSSWSQATPHPGPQRGSLDGEPCNGQHCGCHLKQDCLSFLLSVGQDPGPFMSCLQGLKMVN